MNTHHFFSSGHSHTSLDEVHVDLLTELHAVRELLLVIRFSSLSLDVLLDRINLRLVLDQLLLDVIQHVVDGRLQDLVLLGVVLHLMISNLTLEVGPVDLKEFLNDLQSLLLLLELLVQLIGLSELVLHFVFHRLNLSGANFLLVMDSLVEILHFLQVRLGLLFLDSQSGGSSFSVLQLSFLVLQISLHLRKLGLSRQLVLSSHGSLHMLKELGNHVLTILNLLFIVSLLSLELFGELIDLFLLLVQDFVLLLFTTATGASILQVFLNLSNV